MFCAHSSRKGDGNIKTGRNNAINRQTGRQTDWLTERQTHMRWNVSNNWQSKKKLYDSNKHEERKEDKITNL